MKVRHSRAGGNPGGREATVSPLMTLPFLRSEAQQKGDASETQWNSQGVYKLSRRREVLVGSPTAHSSSHVREVRIQNMIDYAFSV